jgi:hypothetical protein
MFGYPSVGGIPEDGQKAAARARRLRLQALAHEPAAHHQIAMHFMPMPENVVGVKPDCSTMLALGNFGYAINYVPRCRHRSRVLR